MLWLEEKDIVYLDRGDSIRHPRRRLRCWVRARPTQVLQRQSKCQPKCQPEVSTATSSPQPVSTPYVTGTQTFPAWTATATTGPSQSVSCPGNNLTLYTVVGSGTTSAQIRKRFLLTCGRDYSSDYGAVELKPEGQQLGSMAECVEACAANVGCTACGWGPTDGVNTCWLKSSIGTPTETPGWHFAVLESG